MKTMKLNIDLGKYVITGTKHDLILSERGIIKEGENAGKETLSRIGYYSKFEHLVKEL
ncbi:Gene 24 protein [Escherichia coli]|nr:Gene 24 protein [Escherichia coli]